MTKFYYRLSCKGQKTAVTIGGEVFPILGKPWNSSYYSEEKYVIAKDEDVACHEIRNKLKNKWDGFHMTRREEV